MTVCGGLIFGLWVILVACWAVTGTALKRCDGRSWIWWREIGVRLAFFAAVMLTLAFLLGPSSQNAPYVFDTNESMGLLGVVLCALGIGLSVLARVTLGRNWPTSRSSYENVELITTGPYAYVRHPVYGGMILAIVGSAMAQSPLWLLPLVVYGPQFIRSARREEQFLLDLFPERYPLYMQRTKMLLPFVL